MAYRSGTYIIVFRNSNGTFYNSTEVVVSTQQATDMRTLWRNVRLADTTKIPYGIRKKVPGR